MKVVQPFHRHGSPLGAMGGSGPALLRSRALRAGLKTHVPSGFCFGFRAAPRATAPASPIPLPAGAESAQRASGNESGAAFPQTRITLGGDGRIRARTREVQGAQGRVEDPCPIRVLLWLKGGSQGHSSRFSNIVVVCSKRQGP